MVMLITLLGCRKQADTEENKAVAVEVETATLKDIEEISTLRGQLKPKDEFMIFVKTPGLKVTKLSVQMGDEINEGAYLFELDKTLARKQVEQTKINYDIALESYNNQRQLQQESGKELDEGEEGLNENEQPEVDISVFKSLGRIPSQYQSMVEEQMKQGQAAASQQVMEVSMMTAQAQMEQARMAYTTSIQQLGELEYYAPISGIVSQLNLQKNQMALNNMPAVVISNTDQLKVMLSVSSSLLDDLKKGQKLRVRHGDDTVEGVISLVNPVTDLRSNLHTVEVLIENHKKAFNSGGFVHVDIQRDKKTDVVVIPKKAIITEDQNHYVFLEVDGKAHRRKVELGIDSGEEVEVLDGIKKGDRVIVKGQHFIEDLNPVLIRGDQGENS